MKVDITTLETYSVAGLAFSFFFITHSVVNEFYNKIVALAKILFFWPITNLLLEIFSHDFSSRSCKCVLNITKM